MDVGGFLAAAALEERRSKEALAAYRRLRASQTRFDGRLLVAGPLAAGGAALLGLLLAALVPSLGRYLLCVCLVVVGLGAVSALDIRWYRDALRSKARFRGMAGGVGERRLGRDELFIAWVGGIVVAPLAGLLQLALIVIGGAIVAAIVSAPVVIVLMATRGLDYTGALEQIPTMARDVLWTVSAVVVSGFVLLDLPARPGPLVLRQLHELPMAVALSWQRVLVFATSAILGVGLILVWSGEGGQAAVAAACLGAVGYGLAQGAARAWSERDNIFVTLCRLGEGRCLLAMGRWGAASRILWRRARDPGEHVPKVLEHACWGTLEMAHASSVGRKGRAGHVAQARERLTAARIAMGESEEAAYRELVADALTKLQALIRSMEAGTGADPSR